MLSPMGKSKFTTEEKLHILKEASEQEVTITLEKYDIYPATCYSWRKKFDQIGEAGQQCGATPAKWPLLK